MSPKPASPPDDCLDARTLQHIAEAAQSAASAPTEREALAVVAASAGEVIDGVESSSITVRQPSGRFETLVSSAQSADLVDRAQYRARSGPAVQAVDQSEPVVSADLPTDERYRPISEQAAEIGTHSALSMRLPIADEARSHALNLYSTQRDAFHREHLLAAWQYGTQAAVAVQTARAVELVANLQRALQSNRDIGVAVGVLMARRNIRRDDAYDLLRSASQHTQRKLAEIAADVAETGVLDAIETAGAPRH